VTRRSRIKEGAGSAVKWLVVPEPDPVAGARGEDRFRRFRHRVALGIVAVSILAAVAIWRASVYDERAAQSDALFREQLVVLSEAESTHEDNATQDLTLFARYQEHLLQAELLSTQAQADGVDERLAARLAVEAQDERNLASELEAGFGVPPQSTDGRGYPRLAYQTQLDAFNDLDLVGPGEHRSAARAEHLQGVHLTLVAALFVAALLLLTLAEVAIGRRGRISAWRPHAASVLCWSALGIVGAGIVVFGVVVI
jgi:hypothetical protein